MSVLGRNKALHQPVGLVANFPDKRFDCVFRNAEAYDPARDVWYELPPMSVARHGFAGGIINGVFYTATGQLQSGTGGGGPGGSPAVEGFIIGKLAPGTR